MELIWVCWFIFGLVSGVIVSVWSMVKGKSDDDNSVRVYVPSRDRGRSGDKRGDSRMVKVTSESLAAILRTISATSKVDDKENTYLHEAADRLEKLDRLEKWMQEQE